MNSCECTGSVRYIHLNCLKHWLFQKLERREVNDQIISYYWRQFECEICKKAYPYEFTYKNRKYRLIDDISRDTPQDQPFILLESLTQEKNSSRLVFLVKANMSGPQQVFKLGRGHESEIRICDISVSRCHSLLKFNP